VHSARAYHQFLQAAAGLVFFSFFKHLFLTYTTSLLRLGINDRVFLYILYSLCFYRAMHFNAKRGIAIVILSVCLFVTFVRPD